LNDYGIRPTAVWGLAIEKEFMPYEKDLYDAKASERTEGGTSLYGNNRVLPWEVDSENEFEEDFRAEAKQLGWDKVKNAKLDIRVYYAAHRDHDQWTECRWSRNKESPEFYYQSYSSDWHNICYSTESLKFAQSGYLVSIVCVQWADLMICKTRNLSLSQQGMVNNFGNFGLFFETALVAFLCYVPPLNVALGTRMIAFPHFAVPSFSFFVAIFFYDEVRKIWLRHGMVREDGRLRLKGWIVQNTYY
jgi:sodium/potassium-transporting ATPase subunit alpha